MQRDPRGSIERVFDATISDWYAQLRNALAGSLSPHRLARKSREPRSIPREMRAFTHSRRSQRISRDKLRPDRAHEIAIKGFSIGGEICRVRLGSFGHAR